MYYNKFQNYTKKFVWMEPNLIPNLYQEWNQFQFQIYTKNESMKPISLQNLYQE